MLLLLRSLLGAFPRLHFLNRMLRLWRLSEELYRDCQTCVRNLGYVSFELELDGPWRHPSPIPSGAERQTDS